MNSTAVFSGLPQVLDYNSHEWPCLGIRWVVQTNIHFKDLRLRTDILQSEDYGRRTQMRCSSFLQKRIGIGKALRFLSFSLFSSVSHSRASCLIIPALLTPKRKLSVDVLLGILLKRLGKSLYGHRGETGHLFSCLYKASWQLVWKITQRIRSCSCVHTLPINA